MTGHMCRRAIFGDSPSREMYTKYAVKNWGSFLSVTFHYISIAQVIAFVSLHWTRYMSLHFITSHYISLHLIASHYIWLHLIAFHYIWLHPITFDFILLQSITPYYISSSRYNLITCAIARTFTPLFLEWTTSSHFLFDHPYRYVSPCRFNPRPSLTKEGKYSEAGRNKRDITRHYTRS